MHMWKTLEENPNYEINENNQLRKKSSQRLLEPTYIGKKFIHYIISDGTGYRISFPNPFPEKVTKPKKEKHKYEKTPSDLTLLKPQRWSDQRCYFHIPTINWMSKFQILKGYPGRTIESLVKDGTVLFTPTEKYHAKPYFQYEV